jgi:hypothetical protein
MRTRKLILISFLSLIVVLLTWFSLVWNWIHIYRMSKGIFPFYLLPSHPSMLCQHGNQKDGVTVLLIFYSNIICFRFLQISNIFIFSPHLFHHTDSKLHNGGEIRMWRGKRVPFQGDTSTCYFCYFQIFIICIYLNIYVYICEYIYICIYTYAST